MENALVVFYDHKFLVVIKPKNSKAVQCALPTAADKILDWYAEKYLMEREKLTGHFSDVIEQF